MFEVTVQHISDSNELKGSPNIWRQKYEEVKFELEEFRESSRELEQELETQLAQSEKKIKDLELCLSRSQLENESLKNKLTIVTKETTERINQLQKNLVESEAVKLKMSHTIRALEQSNDDLERAQRALIASLESLESQLNQQIEKNVLLETITSPTNDQNGETEITLTPEN